MFPKPLSSLSADAVRVLRSASRFSRGPTASLVGADRIARRLGLSTALTLHHLRELERARLVQRWPVGDAVFITERGHAVAGDGPG